MNLSKNAFSALTEKQPKPAAKKAPANRPTHEDVEKKLFSGAAASSNWADDDDDMLPAPKPVRCASEATTKRNSARSVSLKDSLLSALQRILLFRDQAPVPEAAPVAAPEPESEEDSEEEEEEESESGEGEATPKPAPSTSEAKPAAKPAQPQLSKEVRFTWSLVSTL